MIITIIYGIIGVSSLFFLNHPKTFLITFNYIFNTKNLLDNNSLVNISLSILITMTIILMFKLIKTESKFKIKINIKILLFFLLNVLITILFKAKIMSIISIKKIIINNIVCIILLILLKKIKINKYKDNYKYLIALFLSIIITTYLNINNILVVYFISRLFKINYKTTVYYILTYILSYITGYLIINISIISFNILSFYPITSGLITGLYFYFNYHKLNYSNLFYFYLLSTIFLLIYFR